MSISLYEILESRIMVLDGAMGTMIQRYNLDEADFRGERLKDHHLDLKGNNDLLSLTRQDVIGEIHAAYLKAGADIIETNTFSSTSIAQADYGLEDLVFEINLQAARVAKQVADQFTRQQPEKPRFVAGSIGPTNRTASISPDVNDPSFRAISFDLLAESYKEQTTALQEGGVDVFLIETIFDTLNAKAALFAIKDLQNETGVEIPVMISGTITDNSGRTLSGQTTKAFLISVTHLPLISVGLNCSLGADQLLQYTQVLAKETDLFVSVHPNAGLPNAFGEYDQTPQLMAQQIEEYLKEGLVNVIGGCCGTTPDHIRQLSNLAVQYSPRPVSEII